MKRYQQDDELKNNSFKIQQSFNVSNVKSIKPYSAKEFYYKITNVKLMKEISLQFSSTLPKMRYVLKNIGK